MTKKKRRIAFLIVLIILIITPLIKAQINYGLNATSRFEFTTFDANGIIQNQDATEVFSYGFNTSDNSGCGWIATYNVLTYLYNNSLYEEVVLIEDVIRPLDAFGTFGYGFLGTNPLVIQGYLKTKGLDVKLHTKQAQFYSLAKEADINIILYFDKQLTYGHYQMMQYNEGGDNFMFATPYSTKTMDNYLSQHTEDNVILITINA